MPAQQPLPAPGSDELNELLSFQVHRDLYGILYRTRDNPLTSVELAREFEQLTGTQQAQLDRRRRDLYSHFEISALRVPGERDPRWVLVGRTAAPRQGRGGISNRVRAEVLKSRRCAMCGRTPSEDGVKLVVDHRVPLAWGGSNEIDNLQPLCEQCNSGKKDYFASMADLGPAIAEAVGEPEVHRRLASLLLAASPREVRSDVLDLVANFSEAQEDWQKRLRELRELGWDYAVRKQRDELGRVRSYYRLTEHQQLPSGPLRQHIRAAEIAKKADHRSTD